MKPRGTVDKPKGATRWRARRYLSGKQETLGWYDTEAAAWRALKVDQETIAETAADYEGLTVAKLGHKVLTRREVKGKVRDPDSDWSRFHEHIERDLVGRMAVRAVRSRHVFGWVSRLEDKGLAAQTRRNCLSLLRSIFREAHRMGLAASNPVLGVRIEGKDKDAWTYLTRDELPKLLEAFRSLDRMLAGVQIGTGMRPGELASLRLADVHLDERPRILVRYGSPPDLPTKTGAIRTVPLFGLSLAAMRAWIQGLPDLEWPNPHGLVFPRERGGFRDENHLIRWEEWKAVLKRAGITRRFRWYDFRHTCASWLVSGWWGRRWSLHEVKEFLGHTSIMITQRYAHLAPSASEDAARLTTGGEYGGLSGSDPDRGGVPRLADGRLAYKRTPEGDAVGAAGGMVEHQDRGRAPDRVRTSQRTEELDIDETPEILGAPPPGLGPGTNGLGIPCLSRSGADIWLSDSTLTHGGDNGLGHESKRARDSVRSDTIRPRTAVSELRGDVVAGDGQAAAAQVSGERRTEEPRPASTALARPAWGHETSEGDHVINGSQPGSGHRGDLPPAEAPKSGYSDVHKGRPIGLTAGKDRRFPLDEAVANLACLLAGVRDA